MIFSTEKTILNFHFDYLNTRLSLSQLSVRLKGLLTEAYATWVYSVTFIKSPLNQLQKSRRSDLRELKVFDEEIISSE